jgi:hypothetical protein
MMVIEYEYSIADDITAQGLDVSLLHAQLAAVDLGSKFLGIVHSGADAFMIHASEAFTGAEEATCDGTIAAHDPADCQETWDPPSEDPSADPPPCAKHWQKKYSSGGKLVEIVWYANKDGGGTLTEPVQKNTYTYSGPKLTQEKVYTYDAAGTESLFGTWNYETEKSGGTEYVRRIKA